MRKELGLYINLRPIRLRPALKSISPLRPERLEGCDFEIVRELAGDIYFGEHKINEERASDLAEYSVSEIERVARYAFERAAARKGHLTSVDKANVLASSTLWRDTVAGLSREYPSVTLDHLYVDNAAMQIMLRPAQFDVILTGNMFGDILSDEAAALAGSIGLIPSLSRGRPDQPALYEPIHGSAPTLAGKDVACPLGAIWSATLMLRESFGLETESQWIEAAIDRVLEQGYRTADIAERAVALRRDRNSLEKSGKSCRALALEARDEVRTRSEIRRSLPSVLSLISPRLKISRDPSEPNIWRAYRAGLASFR